MSTASNPGGVDWAAPAIRVTSLRDVPWQIWVVVLMLSLEGVGNLVMMFDMPVAALWLLVKCVTVAGLLRRWRWVFVLSLALFAIHVMAVGQIGPVASFLNLVLLLLTASTLRFYFPAKPTAVLGPI